MTDKFELVTPTLNQIQRLAETMAPADRAEVEALGDTPFSALAGSVEASTEPLCWTVNGTPMAMFGVASVRALSLVGHPWLLTSHAMPRYSKTFLRGSKIVVEEWVDKYPVLRNFVDVRHRRAIRWLVWLGFTVETDHEIHLGPDKKPFYKFSMVKPEWDQQPAQSWTSEPPR